MINRHFVNSLPWEVEKNLYRLAAQWSQAISHSIENLSRQTKSFMEDELNTVANLLTKSDDSRLGLEKAVSLLETIKSELG